MADTVPLRKLVYLEDGILIGMASNADYVREFPFLASLNRLPAPRGGCGGCGGGAGNQQRATILASSKAAIANMTADKKRRLKELLQAQQVRFRYTASNGRQVELTF